MISGASLLNKIPVPVQSQCAVSDIPAAVSVAEVLGEEPKDERNFLVKFFDNQKEKYIQKRMKKLENTPPEKLTKTEKAELEANKKNNFSVSYFA